MNYEVEDKRRIRCSQCGGNAGQLNTDQTCHYVYNGQIVCCKCAPTYKGPWPPSEWKPDESGSAEASQ